MVRITTLKQQNFSQSDLVLICQFSEKLQSDSVLIRPKLASVLIQSDPVLIRAHLCYLCNVKNFELQYSDTRDLVQNVKYGFTQR